MIRNLRQFLFGKRTLGVAVAGTLVVWIDKKQKPVVGDWLLSKSVSTL